MKGMTIMRHETYKKQLTSRFAAEIKDLDSVQRKYVNDVLDALAFACTLQKPRTFGKEVLTGKDFQYMAEVITFEHVAVTAQAIVRAEQRQAIRNRLWYAMGILVKCRPIPTAANASAPRRFYRSGKSDQRAYSDEEIRAHITNINDLKDGDL